MYNDDFMFCVKLHCFSFSADGRVSRKGACPASLPVGCQPKWSPHQEAISEPSRKHSGFSSQTPPTSVSWPKYGLPDATFLPLSEAVFCLAKNTTAFSQDDQIRQFKSTPRYSLKDSGFLHQLCVLHAGMVWPSKWRRTALRASFRPWLVGWLVGSLLPPWEDANSPFLRNVCIQQLADSDASICQLMNRYIHTFWFSGRVTATLNIWKRHFSPDFYRHLCTLAFDLAQRQWHIALNLEGRLHCNTELRFTSGVPAGCMLHIFPFT